MLTGLDNEPISSVEDLWGNKFNGPTVNGLWILVHIFRACLFELLLLAFLKSCVFGFSEKLLLEIGCWLLQ